MREIKAVTLVRRGKIDNGWQRLPAAIAEIGRGLANKVIVKIKLPPGAPYEMIAGDHPKVKRKSKEDVIAKAVELLRWPRIQKPV
jgi:hypothetical protein